MTALTADRNTPRREGLSFQDPIAAGAAIFAGAMYALDATGNAVTATAAGPAVRAVAQTAAIAANGDTVVEGRRGVFRFENDTGAGQLTRAAIGAKAFVLDDGTVSSAGTAVAGIVLDVDDVGVWVEIGTSIGGA
jgi:hypothetical protein